MSLALAIARIQEIQGAFTPPAAAAAQAAQMSAVTGGAAAPMAATAVAAGGGSFSNVLQSTLAGSGVPTTLGGVAGALPAAAAAPLTGGAAGPGGQIVALAQAEVGQAEYPPGSNDSPRIATYREATAGSGVGPWCAYFTSWLGQQAGMPLGDAGQGFGRVDDVYAWAQSAGRAVPNGSGVPNPGDLIVWDEHIGIVEQVLPDGRVQTIEGNSSDKVSRNVHDAGSALGYVRMS